MWYTICYATTMIKYNYALFLVTIVLGFSSCRSRNSLHMNIVEPAPIQVPAHVLRVGIINRSLPNGENSLTNEIEKFLSAEGLKLDSLGAEYCIDGVQSQLTGSGLFSKVIYLENDSIPSAGSSVFPAELSWQLVEEICAKDSVDALCVLSFYDTDARLSYRAVPVDLNSPAGNIRTIEHQAQISTLITLGFRFYDPRTKIILDQLYLEDNVVNSARGINPFKAVEAISGRKQAVLQISKVLGEQYGLRVLPYTTTIYRDYYVRGSDNFKMAKRKARTGNWDGAAELWYADVEHHRRKIAGRACYNMAISAEINGDLTTAIQWATKAYEEYNNKLALRYIGILNRRMERNNLLP